MTPTVKILGQICSFLELTHSVRSPLGSRKALQNRFAEQTSYSLKRINPVPKIQKIPLRGRRQTIQSTFSAQVGKGGEFEGGERF